MAALVIEYHPMTTVKLYGLLRQFGKSFTLSVRSPTEAIKALCIQVPGFELFLSTAKAKGMEFAIFRGKKNIHGKALEFGGNSDIRIAPIITGNKRGGLLQTVVGVVLIIASFFVPGSTPFALAASSALFSSGVAMTAGGIVQLLSPQANGLKISSAPENTPGYAFGSAKNTTASGNPVPLCYGYRRFGGAIISAAIYAEDQM